MPYRFDSYMRRAVLTSDVKPVVVERFHEDILYKDVDRWFGLYRSHIERYGNVESSPPITYCRSEHWLSGK